VSTTQMCNESCRGHDTGSNRPWRQRVTLVPTSFVPSHPPSGNRLSPRRRHLPRAIEGVLLAVVLDREDSLTPSRSLERRSGPGRAPLTRALDGGDKIECKAFGLLPVEQMSGARIDDEPPAIVEEAATRTSPAVRSGWSIAKLRATALPWSGQRSHLPRDGGRP
jgi:hypothetical protein